MSTETTWCQLGGQISTWMAVVDCSKWYRLGGLVPAGANSPSFRAAPTNLWLISTGLWIAWIAASEFIDQWLGLYPLGLSCVCGVPLLCWQYLRIMLIQSANGSLPFCLNAGPFALYMKDFCFCMKIPRFLSCHHLRRQILCLIPWLRGFLCQRATSGPKPILGRLL